MPKLKLQAQIVYGPDDPVISLLTRLSRKVHDMSAALDQVTATLDQVKINQDRQTALLTSLAESIAALRATGTGGASADDLAAIETRLLAIRDEGAASIAAVPPEDLPPVAPASPMGAAG